ncbi:hypothetical protein GCM10010199_61430 [Dactylosporangium roseum]
MSETDDVLAVRRPGPNVIIHRPHAEGSTQTHCGAAAGSPYLRFGAWYAQRQMASPCRSCFPQGWATPSSEGEQQ